MEKKRYLHNQFLFLLYEDTSVDINKIKKVLSDRSDNKIMEFLTVSSSFYNLFIIRMDKKISMRSRSKVFELFNTSYVHGVVTEPIVGQLKNFLINHPYVDKSVIDAALLTTPHSHFDKILKGLLSRSFNVEILKRTRVTKGMVVAIKKN